MRSPNEISNHYPPRIRDALVSAAERRDSAAIDAITAQAAAEYPRLVVHPSEDGPEFAPLATPQPLPPAVLLWAES